MNAVRCFFVVIALSGALFAQTPSWKWETLTDPPAAAYRFNDIFFVTPEIGWAILPYDGYIDSIPALGRIYKTTDGGETWIVQIDSSRNHFRCVGFADSLHGWVFSLGITPHNDSSYDSTLFFETSDGGTTWFSPTDNIEGIKPPGLCGLYVVDQEVAYVVGRYTGPAYMLKTTNGGKIWKSIDMNSHAGMLIDCYFWSRDSGIVVGGTTNENATSHGIILLTTDGGVTWTERYRTVSSGSVCWKISFPTANTGYVSVQRYSAVTIVKTSDRGITWKSRTTSSVSSIFLQGVGYINDTVGWVGGWGETNFQTTDAGINWQSANIGPNLNRFRFFGDSLGYCAGQSIHKLTLQRPSSVEIGSTLHPSTNYPNPFEQSTDIHFILEKPAHVTLKVCDVLGSVIETLVDKQLPAGEYSYPFIPPPDHRTSSYFYVLRVGSHVVQHQMLQLR